jgi:hypothetical protein
MFNRLKLRFATTVLCSTVCLGACAGGESFATRSGFTQYFEQYPPATTLPDQRQHALLETYRPRIFKAANQQGPVDFYQQYIANGVLEVDGKKITTLDQAQLNRYKDDPGVLFNYRGNATPGGKAMVYARFDEDTLLHNGKSYPLEFLTYNLAFPTSGMLVGLGRFNSTVLRVAGNLTDWHQLDHYVGLSIALYREQPVAVMLQQHNYQTTYIINHNLALPDDNRVKVDIAMRSNELYLHSEQRVEHPAVSFTTKDNIEFLMTGNEKPFMAGYDVTHGEQEIDYQLQLLPQTDAFYQFKGHLGVSRLLPGRDGPPGADYVTLPGLMPRAVRLVSGFRTQSLQRETEKISALFNEKTFTINTDAIDAYSADFLDAASLLPD